MQSVAEPAKTESQPSGQERAFDMTEARIKSLNDPKALVERMLETPLNMEVVSAIITISKGSYKEAQKERVANLKHNNELKGLAKIFLKKPRIRPSACRYAAPSELEAVFPDKLFEMRGVIENLINTGLVEEHVEPMGDVYLMLLGYGIADDSKKDIESFIAQQGSSNMKDVGGSSAQQRSPQAITD